LIEIGNMRNSGRDAKQRILKEMEAATGDSARSLAVFPGPARVTYG
jgi:hypothetical protein